VPHIHTLLCELFVCMYLQFNIRWRLTLLRARARICSCKLYACTCRNPKKIFFAIIIVILKFLPAEQEQRGDASKLLNVARSTIYSALVIWTVQRWMVPSHRNIDPRDVRRSRHKENSLYTDAGHSMRDDNGAL